MSTQTLLSSEPYVMPASPLTEFLKNHMAVPPGSTVVDFGCGNGDLTLEACRQGARRVYAIDVNHFAAAATRANAGGSGFGKRVITIVGDLEDVDDLVPEPVDVVLANPPQLPELPDQCSTWREVAYNAGVDGRRFVDLSISKAAALLKRSQHPEPELQMVTTSVVGIDATLSLLRQLGFMPRIVAQQEALFRPVYLERLAVIPLDNYRVKNGMPHETLFVIRASPHPRCECRV